MDFDQKHFTFRGSHPNVHGALCQYAAKIQLRAGRREGKKGWSHQVCTLLTICLDTLKRKTHILNGKDPLRGRTACINY